MPPLETDTALPLATDLYELTMGAVYLALGMRESAVFNLLVRGLPPHRPYLVAAGLEEAIRRLIHFACDQRDVAYLSSLGRFDETQVLALASTRFTGDVWAVPEGRIVFAGEPLLEVQAPLVEAQLVETALLNAIHYPTLIATKAARCVSAAAGKVLVDFGMRRMPDVVASVDGARACYLAGFAATSNVLAGRELGIPVSGTMAHSLVEVFTSELDAFRHYMMTAKGPVSILVDTYDTLGGVAHVIQIAREGLRVDAIRLDSGDLLGLARRARRMLDDAGLGHVQIFASGGLDEYELERLEGAGAPIDGYGIGTRLGMSADAPAVDMVYKVVEYDSRPCLKLSEGKASLVGPKQVWRRRQRDGGFASDLLAARDEPAPGPDWEPLLEPAMIGGHPTPPPALSAVRSRHEQERGSLPRDLLRLRPDRPYPVSVSATLADRQRRAVEEVRRREGAVSARADLELHGL
jgi:nicotinate phosphoribosyltransferase